MSRPSGATFRREIAKSVRFLGDSVSDRILGHLKQAVVLWFLVANLRDSHSGPSEHPAAQRLSFPRK